MADKEQNSKADYRKIVYLFQDPVKLSDIKMYEEDAQTDAEIQNEKQYVQAETGNNEGKALTLSVLNAFVGNECGETEYEGRKKYAGTVKDYGHPVFFCERLEGGCITHEKVYHTNTLDSLPV
jgi:hypothetical protein